MSYTSIISFILISIFYLLLINQSPLLSCLGSISGQILILSVLSWYLCKRLKNGLSKLSRIDSYKKAVLITGCDSGFGHTLALELNRVGFRVYATVLDPNSEGAKNLSANSTFEAKTKVMGMDVTNATEVDTVRQQIEKELEENDEKLWAVINNSGIFTIGPLDWGTIDSIKKIFEVNTFGTIRVTRAFLPLIRQSRGRIICLVSMAGRVTVKYLGVYSMSKHAITSFADALRQENKKFGVNVSTVEPTFYKTAMTNQEYMQQMFDQNWNQSSDNVKQFYGQTYYENLRLKTMKSNDILPVGENTDEVIDKLVEAVQSTDPQIRYSVIPGGIVPKLIVWLLGIIPLEALDYIFSTNNTKKSI